MSNPERVLIAKRVQYGALPYRVRGRSRPEIMLVTSRETRRWIIPKGWPENGKSARQSAARADFARADAALQTWRAQASVGRPVHRRHGYADAFSALITDRTVRVFAAT